MPDYRKNLIISLISYAAQKDIPVDRLCRQAGVDLDDLRSDKPFHLSAQQQNDLFEHAVRLSGDPLFGLHFGERLQLAALGIVGAVIRNSRTIGEALENCAAYSPILTDLFHLSVSFGADRFIIRLQPFTEKLQGYPVLKKHLLELSMAFVLHEMDGLLLIKMRPFSVQMPYEERELKEYQRVFRTTNIIRSPEYVVEFEYGLLKEPILTANYELQNVLIHRLADIHRQFPDHRPMRRPLNLRGHAERHVRYRKRFIRHNGAPPRRYDERSSHARQARILRRTARSTRRPDRRRARCDCQCREHRSVALSCARRCELGRILLP